jgi:hypothetical protein
VLHLLREDGDDMRQSEWVSRMARLAATEFGADWVLNADADEFWWPQAGSLVDVLAAVPDRYGVVRGCWRHFLPLASADPVAPFFERMVVRMCVPAHPGDKTTIFHAHQKVAHRADPEVVLEAGNHSVVGDRLAPLRGWHPIEVLHFSLRSLEQLERKAVRDWHSWTASEHGPTLHHVLVYDAHRDGRLAEYFASFVVTEDQLARGVADGTLAVDTRLRDTLRSLRAEDGTFRLPEPGRPLVPTSVPDVREAAAYAAEASVLADIDGIVRAERRTNRLEERLASLERGPLTRLIDWRRS